MTKANRGRYTLEFKQEAVPLSSLIFPLSSPCKSLVFRPRLPVGQHANRSSWNQHHYYNHHHYYAGASVANRIRGISRTLRLAREIVVDTQPDVFHPVLSRAPC